MKAVKLFQGYLWHPRELEFDPRAALPQKFETGLEDGPVFLLLDPVHPPMTFFEDGTMTETQRFYQLTLLVRTQKEPGQLKYLSEWVSGELNPILNATPKSVGWQLIEDLRQV
ncbi:MAG: DUF3208 domain-containing protein [Meiothermus sp.]|nr:DUF3208 domain-containing protein [Meiothermus sp.]